MASATALLALLSVAIALAPSHANRQPTFDCPFAYGDFPEPNSSCSSYYWTCSFWRSYFRPCPYGLVYNEQIKVCDWPSNVAGCTRAQSVNSQVSFQCPAANGDFPAPTPCANYFYKCSNGLPYKTSCPSGLVYNEQTKVCDWPANVGNCTDGQATNNSTSTASQAFTCPADGDFAAGSCLSYFYTCSNGITYQMPCPSGLLFNDRLKICDWPSNVAGCTPVVSTTKPTTTTVLPAFVCPIANGDFASPTPCVNYFYTCSNWTPYKMPCPSGLVFNDAKKICDWPANVAGCSTGPTTKPTTTTTTTVQPAFVCPIANGDVASPTPCVNYFYTCSNWTPYNMPCPSGLVFNDAKKICDWPSNVAGCSPSATTSTTKPTTTTVQPAFVCPTVNGDFASPTPCVDYFYTCSNWTPYKMPCPSGLVFNDAKKICDWPSNVAGCSSSNQPIQNSTVKPLVTSTEKSNFQCPAENGDFASPTPCVNYFYSCSNRTPYKMPCPSGLVFNDARKICDWPSNVVGCPAGTKPTTTTTTTTVATPFRCPAANGDFAAPTVCASFFYTCSNWYPYQMPCPIGLVFNDVTKQCDWRSNVASCNQIPVPTPGPATFQCPEANGDFPAPVLCANYFFSCSNWAPYQMPCPSGLVYNENAKMCDWPSNVPCCA